MKMPLKFVMAGALVSLATVAAPGAANAIPLGTCGGPNANLMSDYVNILTGTSNGNSCTVQDKTFSNFLYGAGGTGVDATAVTVSTAPSSDPGLFLQGAWSNPAGSTSPRNVALDFTVTAGTGFMIKDASLEILNGTPPGTFMDTENSGPPTNLDLVAIAQGVPVNANFSPVPSLVVTDDLELFAGAAVSQIEKQFSETVPEPTSLAILAVSLLGMGAAFRRHRRR